MVKRLEMEGKIEKIPFDLNTVREMSHVRIESGNSTVNTTAWESQNGHFVYSGEVHPALDGLDEPPRFCLQSITYSKPDRLLNILFVLKNRYNPGNVHISHESVSTSQIVICLIKQSKATLQKRLCGVILQSISAPESSPDFRQSRLCRQSAMYPSSRPCEKFWAQKWFDPPSAQ